MWIQVYYPKYRFADPLPADLPFDRMTHLAVFSMAPTSAGGVVNTSGDDLTATLPTIVTTAHAAGVKVLFTLGGSAAAPDTTWRSAVSSTNRAAFVANIASFISTYNLDGVDVDWEPFATSTDAADFALFIADLRTALGSTPVITVFLAIAPSWRRTLANDIQSHVDRFGMSTYDLSFATTVTVHDSPLYTSGGQPAGKSTHEAVEAFTAAGVAIGKLNIAAPFYAYKWPGETGLHQPATTNAFTAHTYRSLAGASSTTEPTGALWDATARAAYITGDPFTSFSSVQAIEEKVAYINSTGVGGIILWEIGQIYFSGTVPHFPHMEAFTLTPEPSAPGAVTGVQSITGISAITI